MNWLCRFGIHKWDKWSQAWMRPVRTWDGEKRHRLSQERTCTKCGKRDERNDGNIYF